MSDYDDVIAVLEKKSTRLKRQYDAVQGALVSLRGAVDVPAPAPPQRKPDTKPSKKRHKRNSHGKKLFDWVKGRKMWDAGHSQSAIAAAVGCTVSAVSFRARADGWPKRATGVKKPADRPKIPVQKCPTCGQMTNVDPCEMCHTAMPLAAKSAA